ncbi:GAF and ANTAR domain-containing protein [soil metagenome]
MAELTENFASKAGPDAILASVTSSAVGIIDGVDWADILLITDGQFESLAPTGDLVRELDDLQRAFQQGPCLEAAVADAVIRSADLRDEPRWPRFAEAAVARGVESVLSFQLYSHRAGRGALNLFGREAHTFSAEAEAIGAMLATHAANALVAADRQHQFDSALATRDVIGQAKGVLMERFGVDAVQAFDLLSTLSQNSNTPLRQIAAQVVETVTKSPAI